MFTNINSKYLNSCLIEKIAFLAFFIILFVIGWQVYPDYGISIDEPVYRKIGNKSLDYLIGLSNLEFTNLESFIEFSHSWFADFKDRDYGVAFFLPAEILIRILNITSEKEIFLLRHQLCFIIFFVATVTFACLAKQRYKSYKAGLLAALFLIISPRIFAEAFFNDKDIVFMSFFLMATYALIAFFLRPKISVSFCLAFLTAIAIDVRIMGVLIPALTFGISAVNIYQNKWSPRFAFTLLGLYLATTCFFVLLFWPWLWANPWSHFLEALANMSKFRLPIDMNFMGEVINAGNLPWYYIPVWIGVTTPILYSFLFLVGAYVTLKKLTFSRLKIWNSDDELQDFIFLWLVLIPIASVIMLNSVLYNGWRHLYFIYPYFLLVAIRGFHEIETRLHNSGWKNAVFKIIITFQLIFTLLWMVKWHPHQHLYFNILAGDWNKNFESDYWGVSYRPLLEKIVNQDTHQSFSIAQTWNTWQVPYIWNLPLLSSEQRIKIVTDEVEACSDYFIVKPSVYQRYLENPGELSAFDKLEVDGRLVYATIKRRIPLYEKYSDPLLEVVNFSDQDTKCFLKSGWSAHQEAWGIWSVGNKAVLHLPLPAKKLHKLIFKMKAFGISKHNIQEVRITVDNSLSMNYKLKALDNNWVALNIPDSDFHHGFIKIDFEIPNAVSPTSLNLGSDDRLLGIGLMSIRFE